MLREYVFGDFPELAVTKGGTAMVTYANPRTTDQLGAYLEDIVFPCSRSEILRCAEENEAPDKILDAIEELPEKRYVSVTEIVTTFRAQAT